MSFRSLDQFDFHHVLEETPGVSVVLFTAPGCGACKAMRRALQLLPAGSRQPLLFEVDAQQDLALTREFGIFHLPSLFLYRDGQYQGPLQCGPLPQEIDAAITERLALPPEEAP